MNWGPYRNQPEARACVGAFADEIFKQHFGVIWSADDDAQWLRPPIYDHEGFGLTLLARFDGVQPPAPPPPPDFVDRLDKFLEGALTQIGQQELDRSRMQLDAAQAVNTFIYDNAIKPINDFISRYEYVKDGVTVVMDVAGVIAGAAAGVALVTVGGSLLVTVGLAAGVIAGLASLCLLVEDGRHCWFTLRGDEAGKLALEAKSDFRWIEAVGPLLAIPDLALSGRAALREAARLAQESGMLARESAAAAEKSRQASRELRELVADRDQTAAVLGRASADASARAADYAKNGEEGQGRRPRTGIGQGSRASLRRYTMGRRELSLRPADVSPAGRPKHSRHAAPAAHGRTSATTGSLDAAADARRTKPIFPACQP